MTACRALCIVVAIFVLSGCLQDSRKEALSCSLKDSYSLQYFGLSAGSGQLRVSKEPNTGHTVGVTLQLNDALQGLGSNISGDLILSGHGICTHGLLTARFEGLVDTRHRLDIAGGNASGVFDTTRVVLPYGLWEFEVYDKLTLSNKKIAGFWVSTNKS